MGGSTAHLFLKREYLTSSLSMGTLYLNNDQHWFSLEDRDRMLELYPEAKIRGETAIPRGRYKVVLSMSARFGKILPEVLSVPGFSGVRIHSGNTAADTEGCILIGKRRGDNCVIESRAAMQELMAELGAYSEITLEVI